MRKPRTSAQLANLVNFAPGVSGNPKGRPVGRVNLTLVIQQLLSEGTNGRRLMETLLAMAFDGNLEAIKVLLDRNDGKVKDQVEHSGAIATAKPLAMYTTEEIEQLRFIAVAAEQRERP